MTIILKKPLITEKTIGLAKANFYTFIVDKKARKPEVFKAVKNQFQVDVLSIKILNIKGTDKLQRTRRGYYTISGVKKAVVKVKNGQKIALFETASLSPEPKDTVKVVTAEGEKVALVKEKKSFLKGTKVKIEKQSSGKSSEFKKKSKETKKKGAQ